MYDIRLMLPYKKYINRVWHVLIKNWALNLLNDWANEKKLKIKF